MHPLKYDNKMIHNLRMKGVGGGGDEGRVCDSASGKGGWQRLVGNWISGIDEMIEEAGK